MLATEPAPYPKVILRNQPIDTISMPEMREGENVAESALQATPTLIKQEPVEVAMTAALVKHVIALIVVIFLCFTTDSSIPEFVDYDDNDDYVENSESVELPSNQSEKVSVETTTDTDTSTNDNDNYVQISTNPCQVGRPGNNMCNDNYDPTNNAAMNSNAENTLSDITNVGEDEEHDERKSSPKRARGSHGCGTCGETFYSAAEFESHKESNCEECFTETVPGGNDINSGNYDNPDGSSETNGNENDVAPADDAHDDNVKDVGEGGKECI